ENLRMKELKEEDIEQALLQLQQEAAPRLIEMAQQEGREVNAEEIMGMLEELTAPPLIPADDFDIHQLHLDIHDRFRMSQEYEILPEAVKQQFEAHQEMHRGFIQQEQMEAMLAQFEGLPPEEPGLDGVVPEAGMNEEMMPPGDTISANGAVPEPPTTGGI